MLSPFYKPEYKEYRNPKFEKFCKTTALFTKWIVISLAACALMNWLGSVAAFVIMLVILLINQMCNQTIYFYDDKNLGPGWKNIFLEDLALSFRNALASIGGGWLLNLIMR